MGIPMGRIAAFGFLLAGAAATAETPPLLEDRELWALEEGGVLIRFRSGDPGTILSSVRLFHWPPLAGEKALMTIATRPATGGLYGFTRAMELARIDPESGTVTVVGPRIYETVPSLGSPYMWMDFDGRRDVVRIIDQSGTQVRLDPDSGAVIDGDPGTPGVQTDADWHWAEGDPNDDGYTLPHPNGFAYANGEGRSTAYAIIGTIRGQVLVQVGDGDGAAAADRGVVRTIGTLGSIPGGGLPPYGFTVSGGAALMELMHPYHSGAYLVGVDLDQATYGPQPDFGRGVYSPEPETMIGPPGKGNYNALAAVLGNRTEPPAPDPDPAPEPEPDPAASIDVRRGTVRFDRLHHPGDDMSVDGTVELDGGPLPGSAVRVRAGAVDRTFQLDKHLRGVDGNDRIRFSPRHGSAWKFRLQFKAEDLSGELLLAERGARITIPLRLTVDGEEAIGPIELVLKAVTTARAVGVVVH